MKEETTEPTKQEAFGLRFRAFAASHNLSTRDLEKIFQNRPNTSKPSISRFFLGKSNPSLYTDTLLIFEEYLRDWMYEKGFTTTKIEADLEELFNFEEREMIINRCELTAPAIKFFKLRSDPFDVDRVPSDEEMFSNKELDELVERVRDAVLYKRFVCITGAVGTGKTSLKIRVARELEAWSEKTKDRVHLIYPEFFDMNSVNVGAIASAILDEFEIKAPHSSTGRVKRIRQQLTSLEKEGARVALFFDECHRLNEKVVVSLKNFWELTNGGYSRVLGVVLFGQPKFVEATLRDYKFREIAERVQVLEMPSIAKSAAAYLSHKIAAAGGDINELFEPKAIERICAVAKTALSLGNIANSALMDAFKIEEKVVTSAGLKLPDVTKIRNFRQRAA